MNKLLSTTLAVAFAMSSSVALAEHNSFPTQYNGTFGAGAFNSGTVVSAGAQANLFVKKAEQNVDAVGAVVSVEQLNKSGSTQTNGVVLAGALNTGTVAAIGIQANAGVKKAEQTVVAVGAQVATSSTNKDSARVRSRGQTNYAVGIGSMNTGTVLAGGGQANLFVKKAEQSVAAVGASTFVSQTNNSSSNGQTNTAKYVGAKNTGFVGAAGVQLNGGVKTASQSVSASGAGAFVTQLNKNGAGLQKNVATGILSVNRGPVVAAGLQLNVGVKTASQSVSAVGASVGISQINR
jgi:hypothetical protein